jgi:predicted transcriptional regulator
MLKNTKIEDIMSQNVFNVDITDSLSKADEIIRRENFHHIPVLDGTKYVGMLTKQKIGEYTLRHLYDFNESLENLHLLYPEDSIQKAVELFAKYQYDCLPVVDWDKNLLGILSTIDLLLFFNKKIKEEK